MFWTSRSTELAAVAEALVPDGRLFLFYQLPRGRSLEPVIDALMRHLRKHGFRSPRSVIEELLDGPGLLVHARAPRVDFPARRES